MSARDVMVRVSVERANETWARPAAIAPFSVRLRLADNCSDIIYCEMCGETRTPQV